MEPVLCTEPMPLSIFTWVALVVVQFSVDDCPCRMESGLAANEMVGGTWFTVIVTDAVAVPPGPVAVAT